MGQNNLSFIRGTTEDKEATCEGSLKINSISLNCCPPYTEIFSKRRKIYSVCVEGLSMKFSSITQHIFQGLD